MQGSGGRRQRPTRTPFGIRTRLTLSHLAVIVVAMGLSWFLLLSLLERYFLQAMEESLLAQVWGYDYYGDLRVVDAAVKRLRAKLRQVTTDEVVTTVRGVGYRLVT